jgi:hypothetical protein
MLNISKCHKLIVSCSAIVATVTIGSVQIAQAQTEAPSIPPTPVAPVTTTVAPPTVNGGIYSTGSSTNLTTTNGGGVGIGGSSGSPSPAIISRATALSNSVSVAQTNYTQAATALAQAEAAQPTVADTSPIRYGREVADLASCGCPNADTVSNNATSPRPELVAARAAEAEAATQLANAKAEARQFIESVKGGSTAGQAVVSQLW